MVSVRKLEKMLSPYHTDWGMSSAYTEFNVYEKDGVRIRIDEDDFFLAKDASAIYRGLLEDAAKKLGLV
jgi:hypothetical protein